MVQATVVGVVVFLLLVAPGTCYEVLQARSRLPVEESPFVHASRITIIGTWLSAAAVFLLTLVGLIAPRAVVDLPEMLRSQQAYIQDNLLLVAWTLLLQLAISTLLAVLLNDLRASRQTNRIHQGSAWRGIAELKRPPATTTRLSVRLKSGWEVAGYYSGSSTDAEPDKRELILHAPFIGRPPSSTVPQDYDPGWQLMVIHGSEIESITAEYVKAEGIDAREVSQAIDWIMSNWLRWKVAAPALASTLVLAVMVGCVQP